MKIDNSWLQAGALLGALTLAVLAALDRNWNIAGMAMTGFFGALSIHPKAPSDPS